MKLCPPYHLSKNNYIFVPTVKSQKMKKIVYLLPFSLLFLGCQDEEGVKQVELDLSNETSEESINKVVYTIPSPNEQFDLLQNIGGELDLLLIHDLESLDKYSSITA